MNDVQTVCLENVRPDQLSALYDDDLSAQRATALRAHITTCAACQQRMDDFARIKTLLCEQVAPQPDARLRRGILAARELGTAPVRSIRSMWRAVAVAAAVLLVVGSFAGVLLHRAASRGVLASPTATRVQPSPSAMRVQPSPTMLPLAPSGWRAILPTQQFSMGGIQGFAVSRAQPGRLVGCGTPTTKTGTSPYPTLDLSDDGGASWQESAIHGLGSGTQVAECVVVVDQGKPDTIIVGAPEASQLEVTTDAGHTWRTLAVPPGMLMRFGKGPASHYTPVLMNGHLIGIFHPANGGGRWLLGDLSIAGDFKVLDATLPYPNAAAMATPMEFAVDPTNGSHLYVIAEGNNSSAQSSSTVVLFVSLDAGASWRQVHVFPFGERVSLWAPTPDALYLWVAYPMTSTYGNPLQESTDGGVTWRSITTPADVQLGDCWFGPSGQIVLVGDANGFIGVLDELNPATGILTPMGSLPDVSTSGYLGLITGGPNPLFLVSDPHATYVRPLP